MLGEARFGFGAVAEGWRRRTAAWGRGRIVAWTLAAVAALLLAYYAVGMAVVHEIDDDTAFAAPQAEGGSHTVALAAALIERETDVHGWTANDPFFQPGALLDNMPAFQQGIVYALARLGVELSDQIGRSRGSSQVDPDLDRASGLLKYPGTVWIFDPSTSWAPTASSEQQYRAAARALLAYNERLARGAAVFERRADNLLATVDRIASDLGSQSAALDRHMVESPGGLFDFQADDVFYATKGRLYAYHLILRELGRDFDQVIAERQLQTVWQQTLDSLRQAAELQPLVVVDGAPDGQFLPSHLAAQGFYLLRARTQLREISNVLLK